ncbi:MAG: hypothetical protein ABI607_08580 [Betaproteobacteria bacterium]
MNVRIAGLVITILAAMCFAAPSLAADNDVAVKKDLFTVITLQGLPCGEVVSYTTKTDNDHRVVCKDGNRYHVYVNAQGRVVVEK